MIFSLRIWCHPVFAAPCACLLRPSWHQCLPWTASWSKGLWDLCKSVHSLAQRSAAEWCRWCRRLLRLLSLGRARQCLSVSGSISITEGRGPLLNSTTRGTTVDQRSARELKGQRLGTFAGRRNSCIWTEIHLNTGRVLPRLKARTLWCSPLVWQVSFLPGSSFIIARFWFQWHQFTSSTLTHQ